VKEVARLYGDTVRRALEPDEVRSDGYRKVRKKLPLILGVAALVAAAVACAPNATQDSLKPQGPYAEKSYQLFVPVFWIAAAVFFLVEGALILFALRYRHRKGRETIPPQIHGNTRLEIAWTIIPALILAGVAVPTVTTIFDLARKPTGPVMDVNVLGHQWWWEFDYPDQKVISANEMHIPTGTPIYLTLCSVGSGYQQGIGAPSDCEPGPPNGPPPAGVGNAVIHSFWVPELAGTQDVVPGRANTMVLQADHPGTYTGQCKEFCGLSHAYMKFRVVAQTPADFQAWVQQQQAGAAPPAEGSLAAVGEHEFVTGACVACHGIAGVQGPNGQPLVQNGGPNLTHLASRGCFAGCMLDLNAANLKRWLADPPAVKAGSWMPDYGLNPQQIDALVAFLLSLK
jgi:cytochrome c oxidase subunit 2